MSSNSRKRTADPSWQNHPEPKSPRHDSYSALSPIPGRPKKPTSRTRHGSQLPRSLPNSSQGTGASSKSRQAIRKEPDDQQEAWSPPCEPAILHSPHPASKLGQDFHWVPYPLGLMPYDSWQHLHCFPNKHDSPFRCPVCRAERKASAHIRKIFLVAERLLWQKRRNPQWEKEQNEELTWRVNYELGILDPFLEDPQQVPGGKHSQNNKWHPYKNEYEMKQAFNLMFTSEDITQATWSLWIGMQLDMQSPLDEASNSAIASATSRPRLSSQCSPLDLVRTKTPEPEMIDLTVSPDRATKTSKTPITPYGMPTPPSSLKQEAKEEKDALPLSADAGSTHAGVSNEQQGDADEHAFDSKDMRIVSYETLQDFYSLFDRIERTSFVGAKFLEAYAEHLKLDKCRNCWFAENVKPGEF